MHTLERYYSILELEPGGSLEEIHQAYRDLVFVWHPDRYTHNPRLQEKAQAKLQAVNEAHEHLCCHRSAPRRSPPPPQSPWPQSPWPQSSWPQSSPPKTSRKKKSAQAQAPRADHASPHQSKQALQQDPQQDPGKEARAKRPQADFSNFGHHQTSPPRDSRDYDRDHTRDFREPQRGTREHIQMPCNNYNNCVWLD